MPSADGKLRKLWYFCVFSCLFDISKQQKMTELLNKNKNPSYFKALRLQSALKCNSFSAEIAQCCNCLHFYANKYCSIKN